MLQVKKEWKGAINFKGIRKLNVLTFKYLIHNSIIIIIISDLIRRLIAVRLG